MQSTHSFARADYGEVAEITMSLLGEDPPRGAHWKRPGAIHQARWMARNIYSIKMFMFAEKLNYEDEMKEKLLRICRFLSLFYTTYWLKSPCAADAPLNDLSFIKDLMSYAETDPQLAGAILDKTKNHLWYLTQEVVPFALFSHNEQLSSAMKEKIALKIFNMARPESFRQGKPVFPVINQSTTLVDLIGPESSFIFEALSLPSDWLTKPSEQWQYDHDYMIAENFVTTVKVVNDLAERGIKMISDFATVITTDERQRQYLLQAVEFHRQKYDSFKKKTLNQ